MHSAYRKLQLEMDEIHDDIVDEDTKDLESSTAPERYMVVKGSMKSKLPPTLVIKSSNLRVLDPIGQGILYYIIITRTQGSYTI